MVLLVMMVMLAMLNVDDIGQKDDDFENRLRKTTKRRGVSLDNDNDEYDFDIGLSTKR